jgi:hypothetical protein
MTSTVGANGPMAQPAPNRALGTESGDDRGDAGRRRPDVASRPRRLRHRAGSTVTIGSVLVLLALVAALPAAAQTRSGSTGWENWTNGASYLIRPIPKLPAPACAWSFTDRQLGTSQMIWATAENVIATTETKGAHVSAGAGLVYQRATTTDDPPACPGSSPCFTLQTDLATATTCYHPGKPAGLRGVLTAANLATDVQNWNGYATTHRGAGAAKPVVLLSYRWDLVTWTEMQIEGFSPSFLIETNPANYDAVQKWIATDTSKVCADAGGCSWSDSYAGWTNGWNGKDLGLRLKDQLDALGGPDAHKKYAYYMTRPISSRLYPDAVLADMSDDAYVRWRIARVKKILAEIGQPNVIVLLNQKLGQRFQGNRGQKFNAYVLARCPTVTDFVWATFDAVYDTTPDHAATNPRQTACNVPWTQGGNAGGRVGGGGGYTADLIAAGVTYERYVLSLENVADELKAAGLPYAWETGGGEFQGYWDSDPTPTDEDAVLRQIALGAKFVIVRGAHSSSHAAAVRALAGKVQYVAEP